MLGEIAFPTYHNGDSFSTIQKKCADYANTRALEDFKRTAAMPGLSTIQAYLDECGAQIESQRQTRQVMVMVGILGAAGAVWWLATRD